MGPEGSPPESPPSGGFWPTVHRVEDAALTVLVILLVLVAGGQIVMRAAFHWGVDWTDPMLRSLVLWVAMFGAMIAAREDKHLGVDAVPRLLSGVPLVLARLLAQGFAAAVCAALAWYSVGLVQLERESQTIAFAQVPTWVTQLAMPFGFTVMGLRFALRALGIGKLGGANTP